VSSAGKAYTWGNNSSGQLGDGTTADHPNPVEVTGFPAGTALAGVAAGQTFTVAVTAAGKVYGWGNNQNGQLGDGTTADRLSPVEVTGFPAGTRITAVAGGYDHAVAVSSEGKVYAWGG
jgi:alpha-tubulin suppressor-like RCC1 family protein